MSTAQQIINRALRYSGIIDVSEDAEIDYSTPALEDLNQMIDEWSNDGLAQTSLTTVSHALVSGTREYTIGSGGDINTSWPVKIQNVYVRDGSSADYPIEQIPASEYALLALKDTPNSYPSLLYYERSHPLGTLKLWPVPNSGLTLYMDVWDKLDSISLVTDSLTLPPGYDSAYAYNLAVRLAPQYGREAPATVQRLAIDSKRKLETVNFEPMVTHLDIPAGRTNRNWNIFTL